MGAVHRRPRPWTVGDATLTMIDGDTKQPLDASVTRAERPLAAGVPWGDDLLRWELSPKDTGTRLTLRHTLADQDWLPKVAAGWHLASTSPSGYWTGSRSARSADRTP